MYQGFSTHTSLSRDFLLHAIMILVALSLVSLLVIYETFKDHSEKTIAALENEVVRIDRALIVEIKNASYVLESMGRQIIQFEPGNLEEIKQLLRSFTNKEYQEDLFSWIDNNQRIVMNSHLGLLDKPVDVSDHDYVKKSLTEPWKIQIGRPIRERVSEQWVLPVAMGLTDYQGQHLGTIVVSLDMNALTAELRQEIKQSGIHFAILSHTLTLLTEFSDDDSPYMHDLLPTDALNGINFEQNPSGIISKATLFHPYRHYVLYEMSSKYPYVTLISYDSELSLAQIVNLVLPRIGLILLNALFLIWLLNRVRNRIIQPVEQLSETAKGIVRGEEFKEIDEKAPIEIHNMSAQLKKISQYIRERSQKEEELLIKNNYLKRVKETSQLNNETRAELFESLADVLSKPTEEIVTLTEAIKNQHYGPMHNEAYLTSALNVYHQSKKLQEMIADIAALAKMETGMLILYDKPVNVPFAVHRAVRHFNEQPMYRHIDVKLRLEDDLPHVMVDEERFNQIIVNLLCIAANQMELESSMVLEVTHPIGGREEELVIMLKYHMADELEEKVSSISKEAARHLQVISDPHRKQPCFMMTDSINKVLTHMLVALNQGDMQTDISSNKVCRIYVRFPEKRLKHIKEKSSEKSSDPKAESQKSAT